MTPFIPSMVRLARFEEEICCPCSCGCAELYDYLKDEELEESMKLFAEWTAIEEDEDVDMEEIMVEPEMPCMVVALRSTKDLLATPSADVMRALSSPDLLMDSLAVLLFETRHLHYINFLQTLPPPPKWMVAMMEAQREMIAPNSVPSTVSLPSGWDAVSARLSSSSIFNLFSDRMATPIPSLFSIDPTGVASTAFLPTLPPPPKWMVAMMEAEREMIGPNSAASTVSLPSGWDAVSARLSTSSIFNLFSDRVATPIPSLFSIDPTGVASTASTVSVPLSFWDTPSTVSAAGPEQVDTVPSSTSSVWVDPSEVSISSLFMDPSSAHSSSSLPTDSYFTNSSSSLSSLSTHYGLCNRALSLIHRRYRISSSSSESTDDDLNRGFINADDVSSASSGYESSGAAFVPAEPEQSTTDEALTQSSAARMLAECDEMIEKLEEMRKKLREML